MAGLDRLPARAREALHRAITRRSTVLGGEGHQVKSGGGDTLPQLRIAKAVEHDLESQVRTGRGIPSSPGAHSRLARSHFPPFAAAS